MPSRMQIWMSARLMAAGRAAAASALMSASLCMLAPASALAQGAAELFRDADLAMGEQLIRQHRCTECHIRKVGGDGSAIYRPTGRINTPGFLRGMVEQCNTELSLGMFPDEVSSVAAVLNRQWYRFK